MARLLVYGRRDYNDKKEAFAKLDRILTTLNISLVISGKAQGADTLGEQWAIARNIKFKGFPADWNKYGKGAAGPIRNQQMLDEGKPNYAIAFWNKDKNDIGGTADMTRRLKTAQIPIWHINTGEYSG